MRSKTRGMSMNETITPRLLTVSQAARYLAVCERTLWNLTKENRIPAVKFGRAVRYDISDLDHFIDKSKNGYNFS